jgi:hypothetical protein
VLTRLEQAPETGKSIQKRRLEPGFLAFLGRNRNDFRQRAGTKSFFSSLLGVSGCYALGRGDRTIRQILIVRPKRAARRGAAKQGRRRPPSGIRAERKAAQGGCPRRCPVRQFRALSTILPLEIQGIMARSFSPTFSIWWAQLLQYGLR